MKTKILFPLAIIVLLLLSGLVLADIGTEVVYLNTGEKVHVICSPQGQVEIQQYSDGAQIICHPKEKTYLPAILKESNN